jgi:hypothetical protein
LLVTATVVVVIYLILCVKYYYSSNRSRENEIIQVGGAEFLNRRSILREGSVVVCDSAGELMGQDYTELYDSLSRGGDLKLAVTTLMVATDAADAPSSSSTEEEDLAKYFKEKKDLTLPEENFWVFESHSTEVSQLSRRYFANALMTCTHPLVMFTTTGGATPVWQSLYDTWCIVCMEGFMEVDVYNRSQSGSLQPSIHVNPMGLVREFSGGSTGGPVYTRVLLHGGQAMFLPHGFWFSMASPTMFSITLHLRWYNPLSWVMARLL